MPYWVCVKQDEQNLVLPDGRLYHGGDCLSLTDSEMMSLTPDQRARFFGEIIGYLSGSPLGNDGKPQLYSPPAESSPAAENFFQFDQSQPALIWQVQHNLGYHPAVSCFDLSGNEIDGQVSHLSTSALNVSFGVMVAGTAYLS